MQQISMGETFEMIRSGVFIGMQEEEKSGQDQDKENLELQRKISE